MSFIVTLPKLVWILITAALIVGMRKRQKTENAKKPAKNKPDDWGQIFLFVLVFLITVMFVCSSLSFLSLQEVKRDVQEMKTQREVVLPMATITPTSPSRKERDQGILGTLRDEREAKYIKSLQRQGLAVDPLPCPKTKTEVATLVGGSEFNWRSIGSETSWIFYGWAWLSVPKIGRLDAQGKIYRWTGAEAGVDVVDAIYLCPDSDRPASPKSLPTPTPRIPRDPMNLSEVPSGTVHA